MVLTIKIYRQQKYKLINDVYDRIYGSFYVCNGWCDRIHVHIHDHDHNNVLKVYNNNGDHGDDRASICNIVLLGHSNSHGVSDDAYSDDAYSDDHSYCNQYLLKIFLPVQQN